jgi:hypothetical protein
MRLIVSLGLLIFLITRMNLSQIKNLFYSIDLYFFILSLFAYLIATAFATLRWLILLKEAGIARPFHTLFRIYLSSIFLGNFLPSGGLDLVRAVAVNRLTKRRAPSFATVLLDRILGFLAIMTFVILGLFFGLRALTPYRPFLLVFWIVALIGFVVVFSRHIKRFLESWIHKIPLGTKFLHLYEELHRFRGRWFPLLVALLLSFGVQFFYVLTAYMDSLALSQWVPFIKMLFFVTAINFIAMIPITVSGIGVREGGFVVLFSVYMTKEAALSLSLLYYLSSVAVSLIGGLLLLVGKSGIR